MNANTVKSNRMGCQEKREGSEIGVVGRGEFPITRGF